MFLSGTIKNVWVYPFCKVPSLQRSIFIFLGSVLLSVQNNKLSIIFIPVIILSGNFKTASGVFAFVSTITGVITSSLYSSIMSMYSLVINQYNELFFSSAIDPTQVELSGRLNSSNLLPNIFSIAPTSEPSEVDTCILSASLY